MQTEYEYIDRLAIRDPSVINWRAAYTMSKISHEAAVAGFKVFQDSVNGAIKASEAKATFMESLAEENKKKLAAANEELRQRKESANSRVDVLFLSDLRKILGIASGVLIRPAVRELVSERDRLRKELDDANDAIAFHQRQPLLRLINTETTP